MKKQTMSDATFLAVYGNRHSGSVTAALHAFHVEGCPLAKAAKKFNVSRSGLYKAVNAATGLPSASDEWTVRSPKHRTEQLRGLVEGQLKVWAAEDAAEAQRTLEAGAAVPVQREHIGANGELVV